MSSTSTGRPVDPTPIPLHVFNRTLAEINENPTPPRVGLSSIFWEAPVENVKEDFHQIHQFAISLYETDKDRNHGNFRF